MDKNWAEVKQCNREEKSSGVSVHICKMFVHESSTGGRGLILEQQSVVELLMQCKLNDLVHL